MACLKVKRNQRHAHRQSCVLLSSLLLQSSMGGKKKPYTKTFKCLTSPALVLQSGLAWDFPLKGSAKTLAQMLTHTLSNVSTNPQSRQLHI